MVFQEGVFRDGCLNGVGLDSLLFPFLGKRTKFAVQYVPDGEGPAFGACKIGSACPLHVSQPQAMLNWHGEGVLTQHPVWGFKTFGGDAPVPLSVMEGHFVRLCLLDMAFLEDLSTETLRSLSDIEVSIQQIGEKIRG